MVDATGNIVRAQYTTNADAGVYENHRLLRDITPTEDQYDILTQQFKRIEPVPLDATEILYVIEDRPVNNKIVDEFFLQEDADVTENTI